MKIRRNFYISISKIGVFWSLMMLNLFSISYIVMFSDFLYKIIPFVTIVCLLVIWFVFILKNNSDEYEDLNNSDDHDSISRNLYYSLIFYIKKNNINDVLKICIKDVLLKIQLNNLETPYYIQNKIVSKTSKFAEYSFVCFEQHRKVRRFLLKLGMRDNKYIICGLEDEK